MKRKIGSSSGSQFQTPVIKRIRIAKVFDNRRCMTTVFDKGSNRFETSSGQNVFTGALYTSNTYTSTSPQSPVRQRFKLSGRTFVIPNSQHSLDLSVPYYFAFSRRVGNDWVYDVTSLEVRVNESTGDITVLSSMEMSDIYMTVHS